MSEIRDPMRAFDMLNRINPWLEEETNQKCAGYDRKHEMCLLNLSDLLRRENPGSQVAMLRYVPALRRSSQGHGANALGGDAATLRGAAHESGLMIFEHI